MRHNRKYWVSLVALVGTGALILSFQAAESRSLLPKAVEHVLETQRELPQESLRALQDLRLIAAVELSHFSTQGKVPVFSGGFWVKSDSASRNGLAPCEQFERLESSTVRPQLTSVC